MADRPTSGGQGQSWLLFKMSLPPRKQERNHHNSLFTWERFIMSQAMNEKVKDIAVPRYRGRLTEVSVSTDWGHKAHDLGVTGAALGNH